MRRAFLCSASPTSPITGSSTSAVSAPTHLSPARAPFTNTTGAVLGPISVFLFLQGIETLAVRMERHAENACAIAHFLRAGPRIEWLDYVGFPDHPHRARRSRRMGAIAHDLVSGRSRGGVATRQDRPPASAVCRVSPKVTRPDSWFLGFGRSSDLGPDPAVTQMGRDAAPDAAAAFPGQGK